MKTVLKELWTSFLLPMLQRLKDLQVAALCFKKDASSQEILLVTSREAGQWVLPKGWLMSGKSSAEKVLQEAWEEAGVHKWSVGSSPLGTFTYNKRLVSGLSVPVSTIVYPVEVTTFKKSFPEAQERTRRRVSLSEAADLVQESQLKELLENLSSDKLSAATTV